MQYQKLQRVSKATATRHLAELTGIRCIKNCPAAEEALDMY